MRRIFDYKQYLEYTKTTIEKLRGGVLKRGTKLLLIMPMRGDSHVERGTPVEEDRFNELINRSVEGMENIGDVVELAKDYELGEIEAYVYRNGKTTGMRGYYAHRFVIAENVTYEEFLGVQND